MIISLHMPKTAGSSFKRVLDDYYGKGLKEVYTDRPINHSFEDRTNMAIQFDKSFNLAKRLGYKISGVQCIHGHFLPYKYKKLLIHKNNQAVTWLREPTERLISQYYFWKRTYREDAGALHKRIVEEEWSLEQFCLSNEMQNVCNQFLWRFPAENFDFIGITEHFHDDLTYFCNTYLKGFYAKEIPQENINKGQSGTYASDLPNSLLNQIKVFHAKDYELYTYALKKRKERLKYDK